VPVYDNSAPPPVNDTGIVAQFLPDRGRTKFLRGVAILFLGFGGLASLFVLLDVFGELYARHSWPVADGFVYAHDVKSSKGRPGNTTRQTMYWVEYGVRFGVPADQCLTGAISGGAHEPFPCWGTASTRTTATWATANAWALQHPLNATVRILHDPQGPSVKIADESPWLIYPWNSILILFGWLAFFATMLNVIQRRLQFLETFPGDYSAAPPQPSQPGPDDLIDLKLS
jgi:hypothetical protein